MGAQVFLMERGQDVYSYNGAVKLYEVHGPGFRRDAGSVYVEKRGNDFCRK